MSFGFGVGDCAAAVRLAMTIRRRFADAPRHFQELSAELKSLSQALPELELTLSTRELDGEQQKRAKLCIEGCSRVLEDINRMVDKFQVLDSSQTDSHVNVRRTWKRLRFDAEDVKDLRQRLISCTEIVNLFVNNISSREISKIGDDVSRMHQSHLDNERRAILQWFSNVNFNERQNDLARKRLPGSGRQLLDAPEYKAWIGGRIPTIFCPGIPGAGKTMFASAVIDDLRSTFRDDPAIGLCFIYCDYKRQYEHKLEYFLSSILVQLAWPLADLPESLKSCYHSHLKEQTLPSAMEYMSLLTRMLANNLTRAFIVVDALDECNSNDRVRSKLTEHLIAIQAETTTTQLLVTSRHNPDITGSFRSRAIIIEIRASRQEVRKYLEGRILELPRCVQSNLDLQHDIYHAIVESMDGMFLLAKLYLDSLKNKRKAIDIKAALENLKARKFSSNKEALDWAYRKAIEAIESQPHDLHLAKLALAWTTHAKRPLKMAELQHALAACEREHGLNLSPDNLYEPDDILSACAGLLTIDDTTHVVRFVHYTTQEYLEQKLNSWFPDSIQKVAEACVAYVSSLPSRSISNDSKQFPLSRFALIHWSDYVMQLKKEVSHAIIVDFLKNTEIAVNAVDVATRLSARTTRRYFLGYGDNSKSAGSIEATALHVSAYLGFVVCTKLLLEEGFSLQARDNLGRTPLTHAAFEGHTEVVWLLLERDKLGSSFEDKDEFGYTPLHYAAGNGLDATVRTLLDSGRIDPNARTNDGCTALFLAVAGDCHTTVKILGDRIDVDRNAKNCRGETAFQRSLDASCPQAFLTLLQYADIDLEVRNRYGFTPLLMAVSLGNDRLVSRLIDHPKVNLNAKTTHGQTVLMWALYRLDAQVMTKLIRSPNIQINAKDNFGNTALWHAAFVGNVVATKTLLERKDVDHNAANNEGQTPLICAVNSKNVGVAKLLVACDEVDKNVQDIHGKTALMYAKQRYLPRLCESLERMSIISYYHRR